MSSAGRTIIGEEKFQIIIERLCHQLIEDYDTFEDVCIIGIQPKGIFLSDRIRDRLLRIQGEQRFEYGKLDITFYRDDFRRRDKPLSPSKTEISFLLEGKQVVLVDDVLYTGRTTRAALTALDYYGRPAGVRMLTLIDRRFNRQLPVRSDYVGMTVDALNEAYIQVEWQENTGMDRVLLFANKNDIP